VDATMDVADQRLAMQTISSEEGPTTALIFGDIEEILRLGPFHRDLMAIGRLWSVLFQLNANRSCGLATVYFVTVDRTLSTSMDIFPRSRYIIRMRYVG
jgi:hypothetical protein